MSKVTVQTLPRAPNVTTAPSSATFLVNVQRTRVLPPPPLLLALLLKESHVSAVTTRVLRATSAVDQTTLPRIARLAPSSVTLVVRVATSPRTVVSQLIRLPRLVTAAVRLATFPRTVFLWLKMLKGRGCEV